LKYLKKYKIFESDVIPQDMVDDIRDILIDLEDGGRIKTSISSTSGKYKKYIAFYLSDHMDYDGFLFEEISYYFFWLKKYLGDDFKSCSVIFKDPNKNKKNRGRVNLDLNNEEELIKKLKGEPIENLIIEIK
jgi:hypothetical protein